MYRSMYIISIYYTSFEHTCYTAQSINSGASPKTSGRGAMMELIKMCSSGKTEAMRAMRRMRTNFRTLRPRKERLIFLRSMGMKWDEPKKHHELMLNFTKQNQEENG